MTTARALNNIRPVWLVRAGQHGEDEGAALEENLAIVGFQSIPDLSFARSYPEILELVHIAHPNDKVSRSENRSRQLAAFVLKMQVGDLVALPLKTQGGVVALGRVEGPYSYREVNREKRHTRLIRWIRPAVPRSEIHQDLLYSLGAFMTVCQIQRNEAQRRFAALIAGAIDPGPGEEALGEVESEAAPTDDASRIADVSQIAQDQVLAHIQTHFHGHALARLVEAVLQADGYVTQLSQKGPDGGVDILAGRGSLGLDEMSLCVQVKSSTSPADVDILRALIGTMHSFGAKQGLLVSWGGFTGPTSKQARQHFFTVRLWGASDLVEAIYRNYDRLPEEIQAELPLKRVWTLVHEDLAA